MSIGSTGGPMGGSAGGSIGPGQTQSDLVYDTSTASFAKDVIEASKDVIVLVDFWADWCEPCKQLTPIIESVVHSYGGKVRLAKLNVDKHPAISGQLRIQSLPTVYAFLDGRPIDGFQGAQPESAIRALIDRHLGAAEEADLNQAVQEAQKALDEGNLQGAAEVFAMVLQSEPQHPAALAGLSECYLKSGDVERARQTIGLVPPDKTSDPAVSRVMAALDLADRAANAVDTSDLEARLASNPADHAARLEFAVAKAGNGDKERAVEELLELFRRDRNWNDEAARKQLVQFFEAWGPKDPHTLDGRRQLSALMFA